MDNSFAFVADIHLRADQPRKGEIFIAFLDSLRETTRHLFILGDLFDFWAGPKHASLREHVPVADKLRELSSAGMQIKFLFGNRDFHAEPYLAAHGVACAGNSLHLCLGQKQVLLTHGDLLCTNDTSYRVMAKIFRSPVVKWLYSSLPLSVSYPIAAGLRDLSRRTAPRKPEMIRGLSFTTISEHFERGVDVIICGHVHKAGRYARQFGEKTKEVYVLGDWDVTPNYLLFTNQSWQFRRFP